MQKHENTAHRMGEDICKLYVWQGKAVIQDI